MKKKTIEDMQALAKMRDGTCLSKQYNNAHTKLKWRCKKGHEWWAPPGNITKGTWCSECAKVKKKTIDDMRALAENRSGECLSKRYRNAHTKLKWRCKEGHEWEAKPSNIRKGTWCPDCAGVKKKTIVDMRRLAAQQGGKCLSKQYKNAHSNLTWRCREGHEWKATPGNVKQGTWCSECAGVKKRTIADMQGLGAKRGGRCLSETYINSKTNLKWRCKEGHEWKATPGHVQQGTWCPECAKLLSTDSQRLTIQDMRKLAKERGGNCLSRDYKNNRTKLNWRCKEGHEWEATASHVKQGTWCPECAGVKKKTMDTMRMIAARNGGICLSLFYKNINTSLKWRCSEGHEWEAKPSNVIKGTWCPECAGVKKKTISDMHKIAAQNGGACLSKTYVNSKTKLNWRCKEGHEWTATPGHIRQGTWCPECAKTRIANKEQNSIEEMRKLAYKQGGKCLSKHYKNANTAAAEQTSVLPPEDTLSTSFQPNFEETDVTQTKPSPPDGSTG